MVHGPWSLAVDKDVDKLVYSRTGVTAAVSASDLELIRGGRPQGAGGGAWIMDHG